MPTGLSGSNSSRGRRPRPAGAPGRGAGLGRSSCTLPPPAPAPPPGRPAPLTPSPLPRPRTHGCHCWAGAASEHSAGPWFFSPGIVWPKVHPPPCLNVQASWPARRDNLKPKSWRHRLGLAGTRPGLAARRARGGARGRAATPTAALRVPPPRPPLGAARPARPDPSPKRAPTWLGPPEHGRASGSVELYPGSGSPGALVWQAR